MQLPLAYHDASAIEEVPLALWREAFEPLGWPASLTDKQATFTHDDVRDAIRNDDLTDNLLQALEALHTLGTEAGREAITSVMKERRVQLHNLPDGVSERELAMQLYLGQRGNASNSPCSCIWDSAVTLRWLTYWRELKHRCRSRATAVVTTNSWPRSREP